MSLMSADVELDPRCTSHSSLLQINRDDRVVHSTEPPCRSSALRARHSETSKFNLSASLHRLQTCLWPLCGFSYEYNTLYWENL